MDASANFAALCHGNASTGNTTSDFWLVEDRVTGQVSAAFLLLILVVGLPWNLLVVFTIVKEKLYHQPTIVLLLNLVINDLMVLCASLPTRIVTGIAGEFVFGNSDAVRCIWCHVALVPVIFALVWLYGIAIMTLDRFLYIYKPLRYEKIVTSFRIVVVVVILWIFLAAVISLPLEHVWDVVFDPLYLTCVMDYTNSNLVIALLTLTAIPVTVLVIFNVWVMVIVLRNIRAIYNVRKTMGNSSNQTSHQNQHYKAMKKRKQRKELHVIRVFCALLGLNLLSWLPLTGITIDAVIVGSELWEGRTQVTAIVYIIFFSQVVLHPMIETFLIQDVREPLKRLVCLCVGKGKHRDGAYPDDSGRSWSCDSSRLGCCGEFLSVLQAAMLEHTRHSNSEQGERSTRIDKSVVTNETTNE